MRAVLENSEDPHLSAARWFGKCQPAWIVKYLSAVVETRQDRSLATGKPCKSAPTQGGIRIALANSNSDKDSHLTYVASRKETGI